MSPQDRIDRAFDSGWETLEELRAAVLRELTDYGSYLRRCAAIAAGTPSAEDVRALRKQLRMKRPAFAALLGCRPSTVASWEYGYRQPGAETCRRLVELAREAA